MSDYNSNYYRNMIAGSELAASKVLPALFELVNPKSMLDLGCGVGCWLNVANKLGIEQVYGFDGSYVIKKQLRISEKDFYEINLFNEVPNPVKVDLALCLEVAEHLPEARADAIVDYLVSCSDVVYFGAAVPKQGGTDHFNEQWQSYWAKKFYSRGYRVSTALRDQLWANREISVWYRQNALLFSKRGKNPNLDKISRNFDEVVLDVIHPDLYAAKMSRYTYLETGLAVVQKHLNSVRSAFT